MTKIDIISGFLGAGKTTFIKKLLEEAIAGEQVVLIENEFGEIGIDGGFLKNSGIEIREMNSGCICCSLVGDFGKSLEEVLTRYQPDRVIIEPSGVGKLSDVMNAVRDVAKNLEVRLNSAVTIVDACSREELKTVLEELAHGTAYGTVLRSKGMIPSTEPGEWLYFDLVPEEYEIRTGAADYTGKVCVIGSNLNEEALSRAFGRK